MSPRSFLLDDRLNTYVLDHTVPADPVIARLTERTQALGGPAGMQTAADQQALLTLLTRFAGVANAVEVGTFTGTSALCIARGLAPGTAPRPALEAALYLPAHGLDLDAEEVRLARALGV